MELGITTFGDVGGGTDARTRLRQLVEEAELAEQVGLDVYAVGEHHRPDYAVSSPATVLAAIAARTERIRLSSAVTVLSSDDPVRVFQQFATVDLLSGGRAEVMAGRGSFTESFPLFGFDLEDYDELFEEKLELLLAIRDAGDEPVTWTGRLRAPLHGQRVLPRPAQEPLPVWIAVGGTPQSVARAGHLGLPLAVAIIGGSPDAFTKLVAFHRRVVAEAGHAPQPVGINQHGFLAPRSQDAARAFLPGYAEVMTRIGRERGWGPMTPQAFEQLRGPRGALLVGSPAEVTEKLLREHELFGMERFLMQVGVGPTDHRATLQAIELLGTEVAPAVRAEVARRAQPAA